MTPPDFTAPIKLLVIRRDNIGDLVCTTPLIASLRRHYPNARIDALVNSYNVAVLAHNPHLDHVYAYTKGKHLEHGESAFGNLLARLRLFWQLRRQRYDYIILAGNGYTGRAAGMARRLAPRHIVGFTPDGRPRDGIDRALAPPPPGIHSAEIMAPLLHPLGIEEVPPALALVPDPAQAAAAGHELEAQAWYKPGMKIVGLHISARKPSQRWPAERFVELARRLHQGGGYGFMLFWSPGDEDNPLHPGDDRKAAQIMAALRDVPLLPYPTQRLEQLIAGLSLPDTVVCSDGGAMHVAAGLGKPIVCFFGKSDARIWHPWGVPYQLLQKDTLDVGDISVEDAEAALQRLVSA